MSVNPEYEYERVVLPAGQNLYFEHIDYSTQKEKVKHSKHFHEMYEVMLFDHFQGLVWVDGAVYPVDGSYLVYVHPLAIHEYNIIAFLFQNSQGIFTICSYRCIES